MTLPRLIILTTERERFRLANDDRVKNIAETLKSRYNVCVETKLTPALIKSLTADDVILIRTKDISITESAMLLSKKCRVLAESPSAIMADDNKEAFKVICRRLNIDTPKSYYSLNNAEYPVFIKPANLGDSIGVDGDSLCYEELSARKKCNEILNKYDSIPMIEPFILGDEFTVAVLYKDGMCYTEPLYLASPDIALTYAVKQQDTETMAGVAMAGDELDSIAKRIADYIGVARMCRIDFIRDYKGRYHALEINVFPGLGENGYMFQALSRGFGWDYEKFLSMAIG